MGYNVAQKLIASHLVEGRMAAGTAIGRRIDQTLTQDATGTLVRLELEAMQVPRVRTALSAQSVDHNLWQTDLKNADDPLFLRRAWQKFGLWSSRPGHGVSHPVHMERFGVPGQTLLGADRHTCAAGALGMLAMGAGGLEVALAMAGAPYALPMPHIWGVRLTGTLPDNPGRRDFALAALLGAGQPGCTTVSCESKPTSRQLLEHLTQMGRLAPLMRAGARRQQAGCNGGMGMGQAPAPGRLSVRTVPRNVPGRSGTTAAQVPLCSPETATAAALMGVLTDPRTRGRAYPTCVEPARGRMNAAMRVPPAPAGEPVALVQGPNRVAWPP